MFFIEGTFVRKIETDFGGRIFEMTCLFESHIFSDNSVPPRNGKNVSPSASNLSTIVSVHRKRLWQKLFYRIYIINLSFLMIINFITTFLFFSLTFLSEMNYLITQ